MVLLEELVEEVLLRFPPVDPASLVRAALVCKPWYRIVSDPRFRRRFCEFHGSPPMLGFLYNFKDPAGDYVSRLVPTSPACPLQADKVNWRALDARHGRVLLGRMHSGMGGHLVVWDPITYGWCELPPVLQVSYGTTHWNAAVLCAATPTASHTCDHIDCQGGPFAVVSLCMSFEETSVCVYSSETGYWSESSFVTPAAEYSVDAVPPSLVGNALYFLIDKSSRTVRYELAPHETSAIRLPQNSFGCAATFMTMEDGELGVARVHSVARISLWSIDASHSGDRWTQIRVIELEKLLPVNACFVSPDFVSFAHGGRLVFVGTRDGLFSVDLKSGQALKVCQENGLCGIIPYTSFYTLALGVAFADEGQ